MKKNIFKYSSYSFQILIIYYVIKLTTNGHFVSGLSFIFNSSFISSRI